MTPSILFDEDLNPSKVEDGSRSLIAHRTLGRSDAALPVHEKTYAGACPSTIPRLLAAHVFKPP